MPTARRHYYNQTAVVSANGYNVNDGYCVPTSLAMALADNPTDTHEVAQWFPLAAEALRATGRLRRGGWWHSHRGAPMAHEVVGLTGEVDRSERDDSRRGYTGGYSERYMQRTVYPTLAQWANRRTFTPGDRYLIRGTGHMGFAMVAADGSLDVWNMGARKRIDYAVKLAPES